LLVPVWVFVAWHQSPEYTPPALTTIVGGGLILTGLLLRYLGKTAERESEPAKAG
jgi:hypothetical protein